MVHTVNPLVGCLKNGLGQTKCEIRSIMDASTSELHLPKLTTVEDLPPSIFNSTCKKIDSVESIDFQVSCLESFNFFKFTNRELTILVVVLLIKGEKRVVASDALLKLQYISYNNCTITVIDFEQKFQKSYHRRSCGEILGDIAVGDGQLCRHSTTRSAFDRVGNRCRRPDQPV